MSEIFGEKKILSWLDIFRGVGEVALHSITQHIQNETPSEHFVKPIEFTQEDFEDQSRLF